MVHRQFGLSVLRQPARPRANVDVTRRASYVWGAPNTVQEQRQSFVLLQPFTKGRPPLQIVGAPSLSQASPVRSNLAVKRTSKKLVLFGRYVPLR